MRIHKLKIKFKQKKNFFIQQIEKINLKLNIYLVYIIFVNSNNRVQFVKLGHSALTFGGEQKIRADTGAFQMAQL